MILFDELLLKKVVFELRFDRGYLYWDKCGEMLSDIEKKFPDLKWNEVTTELARLNNINKKITIMYNYNSIRIIQEEVENLNQFKELAETISVDILNKFKIEKIKRIGNRFFYIFALNSLIEGRKIIEESSFVNISKEKLSLFGENFNNSAYVVYIESDDRSKHFRVDVNTLETVKILNDPNIKNKFNPNYALSIDVDIAINKETNVKDINLSNLIQANKKFLENSISELLKIK